MHIYIYTYTYIYACVYTSTFCRTLWQKRDVLECVALTRNSRRETIDEICAYDTHTHPHTDRDRQRQTRRDTYVRKQHSFELSKKEKKRLQCPSLASPCHAGRRTIFLRSKMERFSLKQNSSQHIPMNLKCILLLNYLFLWSGFINPPLQSVVDQCFSQNLHGSFRKREKKRERQSPHLESRDSSSIFELRWVRSIWWDYWIYSNITWKTKDMSSEEICVKKNCSSFGLKKQSCGWR